MNEKKISPHNPFLAWCDVCTMWKPSDEVQEQRETMMCRVCRETDDFYANRFLEAQAQIQ